MSPDFCAVCGRRIRRPDLAQMFEMSCSTAKLYPGEGSVPVEDSQGNFPVGPECSKKAREAAAAGVPLTYGCRRKP